MADTPIPMVTMDAGDVPAAFDALVTVTNPAGIDDFWLVNGTDGDVELAYDDGAATNAIVLRGQAGFEPRQIRGLIVNVRYLAGAQPTTGSIYAGGFV